jgi:hypothetical protein
MAGFVRRYTSTPSLNVLTAIEGVIIIDLPPPSPPQGVSTNACAIVGEFADMTYGVSFDSSGNCTANPNPVQIFSGADLITKLGGFDATIGQFGAAMGNGYVELRNKSFGVLVAVPVNMASSAGMRLWRYLPTNQSITNPTPVVPVSAATVPAAYLLTDASKPLERMKVGGAVYFSNLIAYATSITGAVVVAASAPTQIFSDPNATFTTQSRPDGLVGVQIGDIVVIGVIGDPGANGADQGTYRVVSVDSATQLHVELMNGTSFVWAMASSALAYRVHPASTADSYTQGGVAALLTNQGSYTVPAWPITNDAGTGSSASDGTWATGTSLIPVVTPPALTATSADPLSGLAGLVGPTTGIMYTHLVQAPNAPNNAAIDALYLTALSSLLNDDVPESMVTHVWAARKSLNIRNYLPQHVLQQSEYGVGRTTSISPPLNEPSTTVLTTVTGNTDPGVGANRAERVFYDWPGVQTMVPEAVNVPITGADGLVYTNGVIDTTGDGWLASILSNLPPERNPGESTDTTQTVLAPLLGYARNTPTLNINAWILLRQSGICGIRFDRNTGPEFQSGVTTSLVPGQQNINRRKMADYIEDSLAVALKPFVKLPLSNETIDAAVSQVTDFLDTLLSPDNAANQRISAYSVDPNSGNTPDLTADGIFVIIVNVQTLATADFIVLQAQIGEDVQITSSVTGTSGQ